MTQLKSLKFLVLNFKVFKNVVHTLVFLSGALQSK